MECVRSFFIEHLPEEEYPEARTFVLKTAAKAYVRIYGEG